MQFALIGRGTCAFRLNSPGWFRATPALIAALPDRKGLRLLCRDRIEKIVPAFSAEARRWITLYLDQVEAVAGKAIDPSSNLTDPSDCFFAALLPLPACLVGKLRGGAGNLQIETALDIVRFDLVFWDGCTLVAILFGAENTTTPGKRAAIAALERALAPRLRVRRIENNEDSVSLAAQLAAEIRQVPAPHYGPYRFPELQEPLPMEEES
ncbi:hypothetical protein [Nitratireductor luteus]|uniref:hypothetical protein n=1 Tax=Nitratireductor luteus TaxID=2976980 RepID=UPI00223FCAE0|nr:hypothetical protein [Nitratireductor luteus]